MAQERDHLGRELVLDRALADPPRDGGDARAPLDGELTLVKQLVGGSVGAGRSDDRSPPALSRR